MSSNVSSDNISGAAKGVLIVAGISAVSLVFISAVIALRVVRAILSYLPSKPAAKAKPKAKGARQSSGGGTDGGLASGSERVEKQRGPDLKALIKEQQKAKNIKTTPKDEQASHHHLFLNTLKGHGDVVDGAAWSADGTQLLTACEDMYVRLWDLLDVTHRDPRHRRIKTSKSPLGVGFGDSADTAIVLMRGAPDAQVAAYGPVTNTKEGASGYEEKWIVRNVHGKGTPLMMRGAAGGSGRKAIAVSLSDAKEAKVYNAQGRELATLEPNSLRNHELAVSADGRFVAVASFTAEVKIWEMKWAKDTGEFKGAVKAMELKGHKSQVLCVAFSPDSKRCVTASKDGTLRVWNIDVRYHLEEDPKTLLVISQPLAQGRLYQRLAYGPGGVIAAAWEGTVQLLSASNGELLEVIDAHDGPITSMSWCPRLVKTPGATEPHAVLMTSSRDRRVRLWRAP